MTCGNEERNFSLLSINCTALRASCAFFKSNILHLFFWKVQQQSTSEQNSSSVVTSGNELEFIIPHGPHSTTPGGDENGEAYVQLTGQSGAGSSGGLDLQHMSNTVQLRPYQQQVVSVKLFDM